MKDERLYAKFTLDFPDHPKILCLSTEAKWALVDLTIYSRRHMTDGFIPKAVALAKHGLDVCRELATNDVENPSLIESDSGFQIHDFALHQSTKAEIEELTDKRRRAGQKGGRARAQAHAKQGLKQNASKSKPETETETETYNPEPKGSGGARKGTRLPPNWMPAQAVIDSMKAACPDVDLRAEHAVFVDYWIAQPGSKGVKVDWDATWRNWMRRAANDRPKPRSGGRSSATHTDTIVGWENLKTATHPALGA